MRRRGRRLAVAAIGCATYTAARRWFVRWGATGPEVHGRLPGDDVLPNPSLQTTRAITIDAPTEAVWPWLVQMGQDRGGLYSYARLENLFGLQFENADDIVAEWQALEVGDQLRVAPPKAGPAAGFTVIRIHPGRSIVTAAGDPAEILPAVERGPLGEGATWAFVVEPLPDGRSRLEIRLRARFGLPVVAEQACALLLEPIHFVMERKQLLGIRARAERKARTS